MNETFIATASGKANPVLPLLSDDVLLNCMHCGLCLPTCPTYNLTNLERHSPRGRIQLTRAIFENQLDDAKEIQDVSEAINSCLGCLACVTACPAGVDYETIFESAKSRVQSLEKKTLASLVRDVAMKELFPNPARFKAAARVLSLLQRSPLSNNLPASLKRACDLAPEFSERFFDETYKPAPDGEPVLFLSGCIMNVAMPDIHFDTATVLKKVGATIRLPKTQTCCGALHAHNGYLDEAKQMAERNIGAFEELDAPIVLNSAGCGAMMKHYPKLFEEGSPLRRRAESVAKRVRDLSEFLVERKFSPTRKVKAKIAYQDACHLEHGQKIKAEPRTLLRSAFAEVVELNSPECCGSAGIYNLLRPDWSERFLALKIEAIRKSNADYVATANPGCLLQLRYGLREAGLKTKAIHLATALKMAT
ncbi:MAG: (Fe-S)-binding protein [Chloroherpetonaceae bacterium]|nr:(Fe-S)-binding protein [Chloroherpetonaceae bacterium]